APEVIVQRTHRTRRDLCACSHRPVEQRVAVLHVNPEPDWRAAIGLDALAAAHRIVEHETRVANLKLGVNHLSIGTHGARLLFSAERPLVKVDGLCRVLEDEVRRHRMKSLWDRTACLRHVVPPCLYSE